MQELLKLNDDELREKIRSICGNLITSLNLRDNMLDSSSLVIRTIQNMLPKSILFASYDSIEITPFGIQYEHEHGRCIYLVEFNKHFVL